MATDYTLAAMDKLLKEHYEKDIVNLMRTHFPILDRFQKWPKKRIGGKKFIVPIKVKMGDSVMAYAEGGNLAPHSGVPEFEHLEVTLTYLSGVFRLTGQAIQLSKGDQYSVQDALETAKKDLAEQIHRRQVLDFLGTSSSRRAKVKTAVSASTVIPIYAPLGFDSDRAGFVFKPGDHILIEHTGGNVEAVVQSVSYNSTTGYDELTVASAVTVDADDPIYFGTATQYEKNLTPAGLADIFNTAATSYLGLSTTAYPDWKPYVKGAPGSPITFNKYLLADFLLETAAWGGGKPTVLLANNSLVADLIDLYGGEIRREQPTEIKGGLTKMTFQVSDIAVDFFFHDFFPDGAIFALDEKQMYWAFAKEGGFLPKDGGNVVYREQALDMYRADWTRYYALFTKKRNAHGILFYTY